MLTAGMHVARTDQADEMKFGFVFFRLIDRGEQRLIFVKTAVFDFFVDAGTSLIVDAARADVEMAHLGISHLAEKQADLVAGGENRHRRIIFQILQKIRRLRPGNRVALAVGRHSPSVHYH